MNHEEFRRAEKFVTDDERPDGIVARSASRIANYVSIAFGQASEFGRIEARIHAGKHGEVSCGRQGKFAFFSETLTVLAISIQDLV
jgi:hypothetical protein